LKTIVSNLEKEELVKIILHISNEYKGIKKQLLFKYAPTEDEIFTSKKMIKEYINQYKRHGFIKCNKVSDALQGA
jgi:phage/plasmid-associated DNA primase